MVAYVDGGCDPNPGRGAYAAVIHTAAGVQEDARSEPACTNQRAEVLAAILALTTLGRPSAVEVVTDSQYLVKCATGEWRRRANTDLWDRLDEVIEAGSHEVRFRWVRGHAGNPGNERAHDLVEARLAERGAE